MVTVQCDLINASDFHLKEIRDRTRDGVPVTQKHNESFRVESY